MILSHFLPQYPAASVNLTGRLKISTDRDLQHRYDDITIRSTASVEGFTPILQVLNISRSCLCSNYSQATQRIRKNGQIQLMWL